MDVTSAAACRNHPTREAIGICIECRAQICSECVTKVDGINYCVECYAAIAERGAKKARRNDAATPRAVAAAAAVALFGLGTLLTWFMLEVALPGAG